MARLLQLGALPNGNKVTLDAYLEKLTDHMDKLRYYQLRVSFATGQMLIDAQLKRLVSLETTIRHIAAPRLIYGRTVNTISAPVERAPAVENLTTREAVSLASPEGIP